MGSGPDCLIAKAQANGVRRGSRLPEVLFEFIPLSCAPGRIRTCAHGSGGRFPLSHWPAETLPQVSWPGAYRAQPVDAPQCRPPASFRRTLRDRHPGFGEARSAALDMGGNLVAEVAVGRRAERGGLCAAAQTRRPTDAR